MRARVIINAGGGSMRGGDTQARLAEAFARHGIDAPTAVVAGDRIADEARAALAGAAGPFDAVVIGGGDGSISAGAGVLAGSAMPLGVLPLGTLNHFARDLGLPPDIDGAVAVIAAGHVRRVDVAAVNGRVFVNNSSIGLYAEMVADRDRQRSAAGRGKWPAMLAAGWRVLRRFPRRRLAIRAEGWTTPCRTPFVFVGNNAYELGLPNPGRRTALDRGELSLWVLRHRSAWGLLRLGARAALGRLARESDVEMRAVGEVEILSAAPRLRVSVDGEVAAMAPPLHYRIRPRALRVLAPAAPGPVSGGPTAAGPARPPS